MTFLAVRVPFVPEEAIKAFVDHCRRRLVKRVTQVDFDDNFIKPMDRALAAAGIEPKFDSWTRVSLTQRIRVSEKWGIPNQYINL